MMGLEESELFQQIKAELTMLTAKRNRDAVRCGVLRRARLMLGTGAPASDVTPLLTRSLSTAGTARRPSKSGIRSSP